VPGAGVALGVSVPPRLRTMADIPALHRPWCVAVATGLLQIDAGWVTGGPALERWPPGEADLLAGWLASLRAVCAAESCPQDEDSVRLLGIAMRRELFAEPALAADKRYADVLMGYLRAETIGPLPFAAWPPPAPIRPTRYSGRPCCGSRNSPGRSTASP